MDQLIRFYRQLVEEAGRINLGRDIEAALVEMEPAEVSPEVLREIEHLKRTLGMGA